MNSVHLSQLGWLHAQFQLENDMKYQKQGIQDALSLSLV